MIIPNISKFGKAVILSKIDFPFVYKAHAHDFFYNLEARSHGLESVQYRDPFFPTTHPLIGTPKLLEINKYQLF